MVDFNSKGFEILQWWHAYKLTYHALSIPTRDVLTVHVSTVSSNFASSLSRRILEKGRTHLTSEMAEILLTVKDWEQAYSPTQHSVEYTKLSDVFKNLYLDNDT